MKCQDFRELIDSYLCDELLTETNHEVLRHIEHCRDCRNVTEERRGFRSRMRGAVLNSGEYTICDRFRADLHARLRAAAVPAQSSKSFFLFRGFIPALAAAAVLLFAVVFGFWVVDRSENGVPSASIDNKVYPQRIQQIALGDHKNCAVKYDLKEAPVEIDLATPQFAHLKQTVLVPLKEKFGTCNFVESHICKYEGQEFTHLVFDYDQKTMSVLMIDLENYGALKPNQIATLSDQGYQVAHFDIENKAVFVISDLPPQKNSLAAEVLEEPLRKQFGQRQVAYLPALAAYKY
ncbi:MAG: zf-HC2 domain-containing protein [Pyrinomonadaceae bacterium]|nr:zf-HC2 domain-containing protein [Pyrinomonadaceae bacterium]